MLWVFEVMVVLTVIGSLWVVDPQEPGTPATAPVTLRVPLSDAGEVSVSALVQALARAAELPVAKPETEMEHPLNGLATGLVLGALEKAFGPGIDLRSEGESIVISVNPDLLKPQARPALQGRLQSMVMRVEEEAERHQERYGMRPLRSYRPNDPSRPTVVLLHGLNSSSGCYQHMAPALEKAGYGLIVYDFPDNQDLDLTAPGFARDWKAFRDKVGDQQPWALVCHSMGSLVARWYVEGEQYLGDVTDLILIGPPNQGAALAHAQTLIQFIRGLDIMGEAESGGLSTLGEGGSEAAQDLIPRSSFLRKLNSRARRNGVKYRILAGNRGWISEETRKEIESQIASATKAAGVFGRLLRLANPDLDSQLGSLSDGTGDGVVAVASTELEGVDPPVVIPANHVELIRGPSLFPFGGPVACMPKVLEWLPKPAPIRP